ncbi:Uma2 family endonuclease [Nocardioides carbamazepini]|uniref:Uma2 family endonuclease n=1 Tax=Nocardioides carbamazepini TaxID=2854259 RepID=UPI00214A637B|nr:Uma2 family endonuclease [Nocardioides carbamazepini]
MTIVRPPAMIVEPGDVLVRVGPYTLEDLDALPESDCRYELLQGILLVMGAPTRRHQLIVGSLYSLLRAGRPPELQVMLAPFDVRFGDDTSLEPDLIVTRRSDLDEDALRVAPLLAVEVHSPSTKAFDLGPKKDILAAAGCPAYWTIDPEQPELTVWTLRDGGYTETARVAAQETWTATEPFTVTITPADLLDL